MNYIVKIVSGERNGMFLDCCYCGTDKRSEAFEFGSRELAEDAISCNTDEDEKCRIIAVRA